MHLVKIKTLKKATEVLTILMVVTSIFIFCSYMRSFLIFWLAPAVYGLVYFIVGYFLRLKFNFPFIKTIFFVVNVVFILFSLIVGFKHIWQISLDMFMLVVGFSVGYCFPKLTNNKKIAFPLSVITMYFFMTFYLIPTILYPSHNKNALKGENIQSITNHQFMVQSKDSLFNLEFQKDHVYLLEFYFKACLPCIEKEKVLDELQDLLNDDSFSIIYLQTGSVDSFEDYLNVIEKKGSLNRYYTKDGKVDRELHVEGTPYELLIDKHGIIRSVKVGFNPSITRNYLNDNIEKIKNLLNE